MGAEELDLMPETVSFSFIKESVHRLEKNFGFVADIQLEAHAKDERIINGMAM